MQDVNRKPIIYTGQIDTRFSDIDAYGHVNAQNYLDYVATARLAYLKQRTDFPVERIIKEGYAFYLKSSTVNYKAPIVGLTSLKISSHVHEANQSALQVPFTITKPDESKTYADGVLTYVVVSPITGRPVPMPPWMEDLFFEPLPSA